MNVETIQQNQKMKTLKLLPLLLLLALPAVVQAEDYTYTTNNSTITITGYTGSGGDVAIPATINGLSVTSIGDWAFSYNTKLTSVTIPNSVANIGFGAFYQCTSLSSVSIPDSVIGIGAYAFAFCSGLTNFAIPNNAVSIGSYAFEKCSLTSVTISSSVTNIGYGAFSSCSSLGAITVDALNSIYSSLDGVLFNKNHTTLIQYPGRKIGSYTIPNSVTDIGNGFTYCTSLTNVTIPNSVTSIGKGAFAYCTNLTGVYLKGNAPSIASFELSGNTKAIIYYLPGTKGWGTTFGGRPAVLWNPQAQTSDGSFGVRTNQFGFNITAVTGTNALPFVVEACTNLASPVWQSVQTNTGSMYFSDPQRTNYPGRFYRLRSP
jgi:hypothetical protein